MYGLFYEEHSKYSYHLSQKQVSKIYSRVTQLKHGDELIGLNNRGYPPQKIATALQIVGLHSQESYQTIDSHYYDGYTLTFESKMQKEKFQASLKEVVALVNSYNTEYGRDFEVTKLLQSSDSNSQWQYQLRPEKTKVIYQLVEELLSSTVEIETFNNLDNSAIENPEKLMSAFNHLGIRVARVVPLRQETRGYVIQFDQQSQLDHLLQILDSPAPGTISDEAKSDTESEQAVVEHDRRDARAHGCVRNHQNTIFAETSVDLNEATMASSSTHDELDNERPDSNGDSADEWNVVRRPGR